MNLLFWKHYRRHCFIRYVFKNVKDHCEISRRCGKKNIYISGRFDGPKRSLSPQKRLQATSSVPAASGDISIKARLSIIPPH